MPGMLSFGERKALRDIRKYNKQVRAQSLVASRLKADKTKAQTAKTWAEATAIPQASQREQALERLKQMGMLQRERLAQKGATERTGMTTRANLEATRISTAPRAMEASARWGEGGIERKKFYEEYGPGGYKGRELDIAEQNARNEAARARASAVKTGVVPVYERNPVTLQSEQAGASVYSYNPVTGETSFASPSGMNASSYINDLLRKWKQMKEAR
jgi:hypothetical protein